jgi:hypothetical protein
LDQNVLRSFGRRRTWPSALVRLPQEVSGREAFFGDPLAKHRTLAAVVWAAEAAKRFGDGE